MRNQSFKFGGVDRFGFLAVKMNVDIGRKSDSERIVRVNADDARVFADE